MKNGRKKATWFDVLETVFDLFPVAALPPPPRRKRSSFARPKPTKIRVSEERTVCLVNFVDSRVNWHDVSIYFEEDELLRNLRHELMESHTAKDLGNFLYKVWLVATETQFSWFIGTFEAQLEMSDAVFFGQALKAFNTLCERHV